jgi:hypothetical protein
MLIEILPGRKSSKVHSFFGPKQPKRRWKKNLFLKEELDEIRHDAVI